MLLRFDPFRELDRMSDQFTRSAPSMPMDAVRRGDSVVAWLDLPGVNPDSIDLEVERNVLTVRAERRYEATENEQVLARERTHGTFTRQLLLGDSLDADAVQASYADGVLELTVPVAEKAKPRKVSVGVTAGGGKAIEAEGSEG